MTTKGPVEQDFGALKARRRLGGRADDCTRTAVYSGMGAEHHVIKSINCLLVHALVWRDT